MNLSIVIVSWNTRSLLAACLETVQSELARMPDLTAETFVVDNASSDGSQQMIRERFPWVELLENQANLGFGAANNQALRRANGEYVLLLNSDTEVEQNAFEILINFLEGHPEAGAVGPLLLNSDGTFQSSCDPEPTLARELWRLLHLDKFYHFGIYNQADWSRNAARTTDVLKGACMLIRKEVLDQVGLFDEDFFMYSEEVDLCTRIRRGGWSLYWEPRAEVIHHGGQSTKLVAAEMFHNLYTHKFLYFRKHHGFFAAQLYKLILAAGALARVTTVPIAARLGSRTKRDERQALATNYRRLLVGLARL